MTQVDAIQADLQDLGKPLTDTDLGMKVIEKIPMTVSQSRTRS
jgi:hypothetical protein